MLAAGGDGTVTWVLSTIMRLNLCPQPSVGILPLGTGNNMAICLGWGDRFRVQWVSSDSNWAKVSRHIDDAAMTQLDCWDVSITAGASYLQSLPHVLQDVGEDSAGLYKAHGYFYEFLSLGVVGELAHRFNDARNRHPHLFNNRVTNQAWYLAKTLQSGLFMPALDMGRYLHSSVKVQVAGPDGRLQPLELPPKARGIILLNMQIFAHVDMWGTYEFGGRDAADAKYAAQGHTPASFSDGHLEIVAIFDGWTELLAAAVPSVNNARLAQTSEVLIEVVAPPRGSRLKRPRKPVCYCSMDGEPWEQPVPGDLDGQSLTIHIKRAGQNRVLFNRHNNRHMPSWVQQVASANADLVLASEAPPSAGAAVYAAKLAARRDRGTADGPDAT